MKEKYYWYIFTCLTAAYAASVLLLPPDPSTLHKYHLTTAGVVLIDMSVLIPVAAIWAVGLYGFLRVRRYAEAVKNSPEGTSFGWLAAGLMVSVLGLPLTSTINSLLNRYGLEHASLAPTMTIIRNYLTVSLSLVTFYALGRGAETLVGRLRKKPPKISNQVWIITSIAVSSVFTWLVLSHHASSHDTVYHMPDWLVVMTLTIPYLYAWYRGSVAVYSIYRYQKNVAGTIYRRALSYFSAGIAVVISASVFIQFITVYSERINRLNLTPVLAIIYLLLILWAIGYGLIAKGAKKLKTIEEV